MAAARRHDASVSEGSGIADRPSTPDQALCVAFRDRPTTGTTARRRLRRARDQGAAMQSGNLLRARPSTRSQRMLRCCRPTCGRVWTLDTSASRPKQLLRQSGGFEGYLSIGEGVHSHDLPAPQRPQMGKGQAYCDPVAPRCVKPTEDENPLTDVDEPLGIHGEFRPRRAEQSREFSDALMASVYGVEIRKDARKVEFDFRGEKRHTAIKVAPSCLVQPAARSPRSPATSPRSISRFICFPCKAVEASSALRPRPVTSRDRRAGGKLPMRASIDRRHTHGSGERGKPSGG